MQFRFIHVVLRVFPYVEPMQVPWINILLNQVICHEINPYSNVIKMTSDYKEIAVKAVEVIDFIYVNIITKIIFI